MSDAEKFLSEGSDEGSTAQPVGLAPTKAYFDTEVERKAAEQQAAEQTTAERGAAALVEAEQEADRQRAVEPSWQDDYKATIKAVEFDGTVESAESIVAHYGSDVVFQVTRNLPVMPDVVTLRVEQASGSLICYGGQWLAKIGKRYAVIDGDDAYGLLE